MHKEITKKIALYGGAFDPPHKGHLSIIQNLANFNQVNEVWLLPCGDRDDKKLLFTKDERFQLLNSLIDRIKIKNNSNILNNVKISSEEIQLSKKQKRMIPTIELIENLQEKYKNFQFYFVIGGDILETIHTWQKYDKLLKQHKFIIYPRKGYELELEINQDRISNSKNQKNLPSNYFFNNFIVPEISSSFIKSTLFNQNLDRKQKKQKIQQFLDEAVLLALHQKLYI